MLYLRIIIKQNELYLINKLFKKIFQNNTLNYNRFINLFKNFKKDQN